MTRLLVTGAGGIVGQAVARAAQQRGLEVVEHGGRSEGDLSDPSVAAAVIRRHRPDRVVNAAGATYGDDQLLWRANLLLPLRLLDALVQHMPDTRMVLLGSAAEYGVSAPGERMREDSPCRPNSVYGMSKFAAGQAALAYTAGRVVVARIFNLVAPPNDPRSLLGRVEAGYSRGESAPDGATEVRDFVTLPFVAEALVALALNPSPPDVVNICTGVATTAAEAAGRAAPASPGGWAVGDPSRLVDATGLDPGHGRPRSSV